MSSFRTATALLSLALVGSGFTSKDSPIVGVQSSMYAWYPLTYKVISNTCNPAAVTTWLAICKIEGLVDSILVRGTDVDPAYCSSLHVCGF